MVCSAQEMSGIQSKDEIFRNLKNAAIRGGHRGVDIGDILKVHNVFPAGNRSPSHNYERD